AAVIGSLSRAAPRAGAAVGPAGGLLSACLRTGPPNRVARSKIKSWRRIKSAGRTGTGRQPMTSTMRRHRSTTVTRRTFVAGAAAGAVVLATPLRHARAVGPLKVGILLPRSGPQAQFGIDCQRGADVAPAILKAKGFPDMEYVLADTETNVQVARAQAEKLINEGVHVLVGAFDSGASTAIAQVAEQKGVPFVINIAAAP